MTLHGNKTIFKHLLILVKILSHINSSQLYNLINVIIGFITIFNYVFDERDRKRASERYLLNEYIVYTYLKTIKIQLNILIYFCSEKNQFYVKLANIWSCFALL